MGIIGKLIKIGSKTTRNARKVVKARPTFKKVADKNKFKSTAYEKYYEPGTTRTKKDALKAVKTAKVKGNVKAIAGTAAGIAAGYAISKNTKPKKNK